MKPYSIKTRTKTHMSDLQPSCFCGSITCTDSESLVFGMGWLMIAIALATLPTFRTCNKNSSEKKSIPDSAITYFKEKLNAF